MSVPSNTTYARARASHAATQHPYTPQNNAHGVYVCTGQVLVDRRDSHLADDCGNRNVATATNPLAVHTRSTRSPGTTRIPNSDYNAAVDDGASAGPAYLVPQTLNPDYEESTPETEAAAADPSTPGPTSTTTKLPPNVAVTAEGAVRYLIPFTQDSTHSRVHRDTDILI